MRATRPASTQPVPDYAARLGLPVRGLKVGIVKEFFDAGA